MRQLGMILPGGARKLIAETGRDDRGWSSHLADLWPEPIAGIRNVHLVELKPGAVRGNHVHREMNEGIVILSGPCRVVLEAAGERHEESCAADHPVLFLMPPGVAHAFHNLSDKPIHLVCLADREFDATDPDHYRYELISGTKV